MLLQHDPVAQSVIHDELHISVSQHAFASDMIFLTGDFTVFLTDVSLLTTIIIGDDKIKGDVGDAICSSNEYYTKK